MNNAVKDYCQHHELNRPDVNILKACAVTGCALVVAAVIAYGVHHLTGFSFWMLFELLFWSGVLCAARRILVFAVECYQRYASESLRRQCSCMPSCSEYALMALEKYPWPMAVWKTWRRVTKTCMQPGYHIDNP